MSKWLSKFLKLADPYILPHNSSFTAKDIYVRVNKIMKVHGTHNSDALQCPMK